MSSFTSTVDALAAVAGRTPNQLDLWRRFQDVGLPTTEDEVWRYAPLSEFSIDAYASLDGDGDATGVDRLDDLATDASITVTVVDGRLHDVTGATHGVTVSEVEAGVSAGTPPFAERYGDDAFSLLAGSLAPATVVISVADGVRVPSPVRIVVLATAPSSFSSLRVVAGSRSQLSVIESYTGGAKSLVAPLSEYVVADAASLDVTTVQRLAHDAWHVARTTAFVGADATMRQSCVGLGAHYDRSRNDAEILGAGGSSELLTTFLGTGDQVHDFRTHQRHVAPRTRSALISKGAVADTSRCIYTGLIEIEKGAKKTDARQRNHNLLLAPTAHADAVPNLDIKENDVMCAHASAVGPLDEVQRWYLESRGVPREDAERILVQGFFTDMTAQMRPSVAALVNADVARALAVARGGAA